MTRSQAIQKYGEKFPAVKLYQEADRFVYINDHDPDLQKWRVQMQLPPDWAEIENFGSAPEHQYFKREEYPSRLKLLEDNIRKRCMKNRKAKETDVAIEKRIYEETWSALETQTKDYKDEIEWIRGQWYYFENGKWFFINGKPYHIPKWQWFYLNYFELEDQGLPDFRYRDLKWFWAQQYISETDETLEYKIVEENGQKVKKLILLDDGTPKMKSLGVRTLYGTNNLKGRRVGETSKSQCINLHVAISKMDANCGIQGNNENTASDIYEEKLLYAYYRIAFFFKPEQPNLSNKSGLYFAGHHGMGGLNSKIVYATTAKKEFFDQKRLDFIHMDEIGKTRLENIVDRHNVVKLCCSAGDVIKGFMICTSTAEDMEAEAGILFEKLTMDSMFESRLTNGQTKSGLVNVYFPMYEAYEGFIDPYGFGIIDNPTPEQIKFMSRVEKNEKGEVMGAKEYLRSVEKDLSDSGDLNALASFQRKHPSSFRECFALASRGNNFNTKILQERIMHLKFTKNNKIRVGRFEWTGEKFNSKVAWVDDPEGPFQISMQLPKGRESRTIFDGTSKMPGFDDGIVISADPYRFSKTDHDRKSDGAIAAFRMYDDIVDGNKETVQEWDTENFVCDYLYREVDIDAFSDQVLKCAIYYNALVYPEANVGSVQEYFIKNGYYGYLMFDVNRETNQKKNNAGFNSSGSSIKPKLFTYADTWINFHASKCDHIRILEDYMNIKDFDDMKNKDMFVAASGCLLAKNSRYTEDFKAFSDQSKNGVELDGWF